VWTPFLKESSFSLACNLAHEHVEDPVDESSFALSLVGRFCMDIKTGNFKPVYGRPEDFALSVFGGEPKACTSTPRISKLV
jgi:hypothetical protein